MNASIVPNKAFFEWPVKRSGSFVARGACVDKAKQSARAKRASPNARLASFFISLGSARSLASRLASSIFIAGRHNVNTPPVVGSLTPTHAAVNCARNVTRIYDLNRVINSIIIIINRCRRCKPCRATFDNGDQCNGLCRPENTTKLPVRSVEARRNMASRRKGKPQQRKTNQGKLL